MKAFHVFIGMIIAISLLSGCTAMEEFKGINRERVLTDSLDVPYLQGALFGTSALIAAGDLKWRSGNNTDEILRTGYKDEALVNYFESYGGIFNIKKGKTMSSLLLLQRSKEKEARILETTVALLENGTQTTAILSPAEQVVYYLDPPTSNKAQVMQVSLRDGASQPLPIKGDRLLDLKDGFLTLQSGNQLVFFNLLTSESTALNFSEVPKQIHRLDDTLWVHWGSHISGYTWPNLTALSTISDVRGTVTSRDTSLYYSRQDALWSYNLQGDNFKKLYKAAADELLYYDDSLYLIQGTRGVFRLKLRDSQVGLVKLFGNGYSLLTDLRVSPWGISVYDQTFKNYKFVGTEDLP